MRRLAILLVLLPGAAPTLTDMFGERFRGAAAQARAGGARLRCGRGLISAAGAARCRAAA
jgi:hypothetical protein